MPGLTVPTAIKARSSGWTSIRSWPWMTALLTARSGQVSHAKAALVDRRLMAGTVSALPRQEADPRSGNLAGQDQPSATLWKLRSRPEAVAGHEQLPGISPRPSNPGSDGQVPELFVVCVFGLPSSNCGQPGATPGAPKRESAMLPRINAYAPRYPVPDPCAVSVNTRGSARTSGVAILNVAVRDQDDAPPPPNFPPSPTNKADPPSAPLAHHTNSENVPSPAMAIAKCVVNASPINA
jgi:hypothetical protein